MFENERLGARSKLIPRSPRTYQFEPISNERGLGRGNGQRRGRAQQIGG